MKTASFREWFLIMLAVALIWLCFTGCREARELKKDEKAFTRIVGQTRPNLTKKTDAALDAMFPCQNFITKTEYKKGDTVFHDKLIFDSTRVIKYLDSVANIQYDWSKFNTTIDSNLIERRECYRLIAEAYNTSYKQAIWECNQKPPNIRTDTIFNTAADLKRINQLEGERDVLNGMYQQSEKQAESAKKDAKRANLWLIIVSGIFGLSLIGFIWSKFKGKTAPTSIFKKLTNGK